MPAGKTVVFCSPGATAVSGLTRIPAACRVSRQDRRHHDRTVCRPRFASLVPSVTELVAALGLRPDLVARTG
jgi:ABC-type hemin transport system substrate-binding protein